MTPSLITGSRRSPVQVLRNLTDFLAALKPGSGAFIMLTGPHGAGKTELLQDLLANSQGWTSYRVTSLSWRAQQSGAVVEFLLNRAGKQSVDLLTAFDKPKSSVLLVIDDAHWADEDSLRELFEVTRALKHARIAVVLTALDDAGGVGEPSMAQLRDMADMHVGLPPYDVDDVRAFALAHVGAHISPDTAAKIHSITGGRPGLIKEVLDAGSADHWQVADPRIPIPRSWHAAFRRRLGEHSSPQMRLVLIAAALKQEEEVASGHFIEYLAGDDQEVVEKAFSLGILERAMPSENHVVNFVHPTDRAVVRSLLSPSESHRLHQKAANFYRERGQESAALLHEALGVQGTDEKIALALNSYGEERAEGGWWRSAADAFQMSARVTEDPALVRERQLSSIEALVSASDIPQARQYADAFSPVTGDSRVYALRGHIAMHEGRRSESVDLITRAWATLEEEGNTNPQDRARVASRQALLNLLEWRPEQIISWAEVTDRWAVPGSSMRPEARYVAMIGTAATTGQVTGDQSFPGETPVLAQRRDMAVGWVALAQDDPVYARQRLSRSRYIDSSERIDLWMDAWLARCLIVLGEFQEAQRAVERGLARAERFGIHFLEPLLLWSGSQIASLRGEKELANSYASRLVISSDSFPIQRIASHIARLQLANVNNDQVAAHRAGEALADLQSHTDFGHPGFWVWEHIWANHLVISGRIDEADALITRAEERNAGSGLDSVTARLAVARAGIMVQQGKTEAGLAVYDDAIDLISTLHMPTYQANMLYDYGRTLRRLGRRRRADEVLGTAQEVFAALGAHEFVERCRRERRASGLGSRARQSGDLTPQEEEITKLVSAGATNQEVAQELYLSPKTVEYHLTRVYRKLGVRTRNELAALMNTR